MAGKITELEISPEVMNIINATKAHADSSHAPLDAQKNSDITKAEIEAKLTDTIASHNHNFIIKSDTRSSNFDGFEYNGVSLHLKSNTTDGLNDGGSYHGTLHLTQWSDASGGKAHQIGLTDNDQIWHRHFNTSWSSWRQVWDSGNFNPSTKSDTTHNRNSVYINKTGDTITGKISVGNTANRSAGMYGIYDSTKIGHIWSMGAGYTIPDDGSTFGSLYGLAYKHTNNATGGVMANGHQMVWCSNGIPTAALGTNIWTSGMVLPGNNTSYTTAQARKVILSTANPSGGGNGDIWIKYV